jgi:hypothetical protein
MRGRVSAKMLEVVYMIFQAECPGVDWWSPPKRGTALFVVKNPWAAIGDDHRP